MTEMMGVKIETLVTVATSLGVLWAIYRHINNAERQIIEKLKRELHLDQAEIETGGTPTKINPTPLPVILTRGFVDRESYHKHCEINRSEHRRIEDLIESLKRQREADRIADASAAETRVNSLRSEIGALAREVAAVLERSESTQAEVRLLNQNLMNFIKNN